MPTPSGETPAPASTGDVAPTGDLGSRLSVAYDALAEADFTGLVMVKDGDALVTRGFGLADRDANTQWDQHTVFTVGSITKQFTGAAIVKLEMEGRLSFDDPLAQHVPYATGELASVTLHELLTHTAGLPGGVGDDFEAVDRQGIVELSADATEITGEFNYSNTGYSLLGVVIEEITGMSYEEYLRTALFEPAGMMDTGYLLPDWSDKLLAVGYDGDDVWGRVTERSWAEDGPYWHLRANGGIHSTGADMMRWHDALAGEDLFDADAKAALFGRHVAEGPEGGRWYYAYGWSNVALPDGTTLITHNGGNGVFFADFLRFIDDDLTILVATNEAGADEDAAFRVGDVLRGTTMVGPVTENCVPNDVSEFEVLADFPDGVKGDAVRGMFEAVTDATDEERRAFSVAHLPPYLVEGMSHEQVSAELALIREEFAPFTYREIRQSGSHTFHLVWAGTPQTEGDAVITVALDPAAPSDIACVDFGFGF